MTNNKIAVKDFSYIGGFNELPSDVKKAVIMEEINPSRYNLLGLVNQYSKAKFAVRFHNKRNKFGVWIR
jgi:hypothetical protein